MRCDDATKAHSWAATQFQSAHLREVWPIDSIATDIRHAFQSAHLREVWLMPAGTSFIRVAFQSAHLREVWLISKRLNVRYAVFQSAHLREVWHNRLVPFAHSTCFNPHTYVRCDSKLRYGITYLLSFNPHTYVRCDSAVENPISKYEVSIRTPTWGVTCANCSAHSGWRVSIRTPTWGVTW